jgi:hypothetical protein
MEYFSFLVGHLRGEDISKYNHFTFSGNKLGQEIKSGVRNLNESGLIYNKDFLWKASCAAQSILRSSRDEIVQALVARLVDEENEMREVVCIKQKNS